jgi:excinuclease UvrABC ATPase subunit
MIVQKLRNQLGPLSRGKCLPFSPPPPPNHLLNQNQISPLKSSFSSTKVVNLVNLPQSRIHQILVSSTSNSSSTTTLRRASNSKLERSSRWELTTNNTYGNNRKTSQIIMHQPAAGQVRRLNCWSCSEKLDKKAEYALLVCPKCNSLQNLRGSDIPNFYELLGQEEETYRVDVSELSQKVKKLQRKLHPDLYAHKGKVGMTGLHAREMTFPS